MPDINEELPRFACPDWWERLLAGRPPMADVPYDKVKAGKAIAFFNRLRLPDVPGNPPLAEACGDWFRDMLAVFLASEDPETLLPTVWELLCMVPKKNSKTTYVAGLALTALYMIEVPNRQMLLVGPSQNISERCFDQAQGMIRLDPKLEVIFKVQDHTKTITRYKTGTCLDVKTFDTSIVTGEIPILTIIDEVHELGKKAKAAAVMQQIRGGGITKQRGRLLMITTQSDEPPAGIWRTELDKARKIRDGKGGRLPIMLPVLYEYPVEKQLDQDFWRNPKNWDLILPNIGRSIDPQALFEDYENNGRVNKEAEQIWTSQHLNIEIGVGLGGDGWSGALHWTSCVDDRLSGLDALLARSEVCTIGGDWGGADDLAALYVIGREKHTKRWLGWGRAWARPSVFEQRKSIAPRLRQFAEDGDLVISKTGEEQAASAAEICRKVFDAGLLPETGGIGLDSAGIALLVDALGDLDLVDPLVQAVIQGWRLQTAISSVPLKLEDQRFLHGDQPLMAWAVGNAKQTLKGSNYVVTKEVSGAAKIDPLMALFNAAMLMFQNPEAAGKKVSVYEEMARRQRENA
ncbi:Putative phage terminase, large subunit [Neorhizobium galegae bv. officinalis bv. officinalis str. HAMBI 1141]|uniref:Putative phage terminase, large subunit n=1 Tax=Neorhizobium galegae bv. officinalis bv. officinalis str. HAMBI 1141 TaxID=1028801 RepID=A0A068T5C6_NEOGA|nr:terminase large subunit [Neorhizobium galegae]CDN52525.1 Putative phage terminase, large subunit [Neorhizobium galegae bv. officinalis bv. officinalis str. HAMBI 1141]